MRPVIIVDANPIISALIGGFSREVFFNHHFDFITTHFTLLEVDSYLSYIAKKAKMPEKNIKYLLSILPITVYPRERYEEYIDVAKSLIIDQKDVEILALTLATHYPLWSNDTHFENIKEICLIKTKDFI